MKHVVCELTSMTSYRITLPDKSTRDYHCQLVFIATKDGKKPEAVNPTHNEAWARILQWSNSK